MGAVNLAPTSDIEQFMTANLFLCGRLAARITVRQCQTNQARDLYLCGSCPSPETAKAAVLPQPKRHKGDNPASPWRKQLYDRAELAKHEAQQSDQSDEKPAASAVPQEVKPVAGKRATCVECKRTDMAIVSKGLCGRCFTRAVKAGIIKVKHRKPAAAPAPAGLRLDPEHPLAGPAVPPPCSRRATRRAGDRTTIRKTGDDL